MRMQLVKPAASLGGPTEVGGERTMWAAESNVPATSEVSESGVSRMGAGRVLDTYKSFAAYSDDRFNRHIRVAEGYMKQGRFYRAADAYTLAIVYKPNDPLGYAGKSHALFAAGEYMSSALFLARALEVFPAYAKFKVDLIGMIGDKDTVENRIIEAREWLNRSGSGELEFLLSYVYYQLDRLEFARKAIESAATKMPDSPEVAAMKKVIDERIANL
jgi:tetratricopeptide (TPR) repeat protein